MDDSQRKHDRWMERYRRRPNPNFEEYNGIISRNNSLLENINKGVACISKRSYREAIQILSIAIKAGQQLLSEDNLLDECELAKAYLNRGVAFEYWGRRENALADKKKSVEMLERSEHRNELDDKSILETARENLRITESNMKPVAKSQERRINTDIVKSILESRKNKVTQNTRSDEKSDHDTSKTIDTVNAIEDAEKYTMDGLTAFQNNEYSKATSYFDDAIKLMEDSIRHGGVPDFDVLAKAYTGRGLAYLSSENPGRSKSDLSKGIEIWERLKSENKYVDETMLNYARTILTTVFNVTLHKTDDSMLDSIGNDYTDDLSALATLRMALGVSCDQREEYEEANVYYTECIQLFEKLGNKRDASDKSNMALAYMNRASNYYSMDNIDEALPDYDRAINILFDMQKNNELEDAFDLFMAYKNRSKAYEKTADIVSAIDDIILALRVLKDVFSNRRELQEHYYDVLEELIDMIDYEDDEAKKQSVLNDFLHSMRHKAKITEAQKAHDRLSKKGVTIL